MKRKYLDSMLTAGALVLLAIAAPASAEIIGFEDIASPGCCTFLPDPYHGFTWSGAFGDISWVIADESSNVFSGTEAHSGQNYAWSNGGANLSLAGGTFDMIEMWARIGNLTSGSAIAHGFSGATELFTQNIDLTDEYQLINMNFTGITSWTLTNQANNVLIDDIQIQPAPEPATLALLGLGLAGLGFSRRKQ